MAKKHHGGSPDMRESTSQRESDRRRMSSLGEPCALCGKPIDYSLRWWTDPKDGRRKRHPHSFEVDHKMSLYECRLRGLPRSFYSSLENKQPSHRICNQRKGAGMNKEKLSRPMDSTSRAW